MPRYVQESCRGIMSDNKPVRRIIDNRHQQVVVMPSAENLIGDAMRIIELELVKFKAKVSKGTSLTAEEGRLLNGYIGSLVSLSKEDRDRTRNTDLSNLSTEEIIHLLTKPATVEQPPTTTPAILNDSNS